MSNDNFVIFTAQIPNIVQIEHDPYASVVEVENLNYTSMSIPEFSV